MSEAQEQSVLARIGNTPLVELIRLPSPGAARVLVKLESMNPSGSSKDRSAISMVGNAEAEGRLRPGMRIVECTGGSTGTALAMIAAVKGYDCTIVTSDAFADEKLKAIAAFGAQLDIIPSKHGKSTYPELFDEMGQRVRELAAREGSFWTDQMRNPDNLRGYASLGREVVAVLQAEHSQADAFVMACGSGGCFSGTGGVLKQTWPGLLATAVEPAAYRHISGGPKGVHRIDGVGDGPPGVLFRRDLVDSIEAVTDEEAVAMARRLAREEGVFGGRSAAANVVVALRVAERLGKDKTVVTIICDSGYKYLSGDTFGI